MNACCRGWSSPSDASPSTVVTSAPSCATARARHAFARRPSIRTVHAPHWTWSQPFLAPVRPSSSRSRSSSDVRVSISSECGSPLIRSVIGSRWAGEASMDESYTHPADGETWVTVGRTGAARGRSRRRREDQAEAAAATRAGFGGRPAAVRAGDLLDKREADAGAAGGLRARGVEPGEAVEHALPRIGRDAGSLVEHVEPRVRAVRGRADHHGATGRAVLDRVVEQVRHRLGEPAGVTADGRGIQAGPEVD